MFLNREPELAELRRLVSDPHPSLVILRGRRRVGKSSLLREAISDGRVISFQADEQDQGGHLRLLAAEAARLLPGTPPLAFADWDEALSFFGVQAGEAPLVLILDEFQYLASAQPALPSIIQRHWDDWSASQLPICIVLAGSALSFMEGLLDHGAPLFGRATYRPLLVPFDYRQAAAFAADTAAPTELLKRFAMIGGTPQYQAWAGRRVTGRVLRESILSKGQPLYEEPLQLLRGEGSIRDPSSYFAAMRAIAEGNTRTGEIANAIHIDTSQATKFLNRLVELGYVELREPLARGQSGRAIWRISDPYFRFWFRFVFKNRSRLEREAVDEIAEEIGADLDTYMGWEFEEACRVWIGKYSELGRASSRVGSWWSRQGNAEIDVVCMTGNDYTALGSCKWTSSVDERVLDQLYEHRALLGGRAAQARLVLFGRDRFTDFLERRADEENVLLVTAADLFAD